MSQLHASIYEAVIEKSGFAACALGAEAIGLSYCARALPAAKQIQHTSKNIFRIESLPQTGRAGFPGDSLHGF